MYLLKIRLFVWGGQVFPQDRPLYLGRIYIWGTSISSIYAFIFGEDKYFLKIGLCIWGVQVFPQDMPLFLGRTSFSSRYAFVFGEDFEIYFPLHYTGSGGVSGDNQSFLT